MAGKCIHPDCQRDARSRGMCNSHYTMWRRKTPVDTTPIPSTERVLDVLPATYAQAAAKSGLCYDTARRALNELHAAGRVHVEDLVPPVRAGGKYVSVFAAGPGEDAKVSPQAKRQHALRGRRVKHRARRAPIYMDPLVAALFGRSKPQQQRGEA